MSAYHFISAIILDDTRNNEPVPVSVKDEKILLKKKNRLWHLYDPNGEINRQPKEFQKGEAIMELQDFGTKPMIYEASDHKTICYRQGVYNADRPGDFCLFLFFHGAGERGNDNKSQLTYIAEPLTKYLEEEKIKCVFLLPQCPSNERWTDKSFHADAQKSPNKPMQYATELLDAKITEFHVDRRRIYICGISMGGYATWDLLCRRPDFFAAGMPICGGVDCEQVVKLKDVPLTIYHGGIDDVIPVSCSRDAVDALKKAGSTSFKYMEIPGVGHNVWISCFQDRKNFAWMFEQRRIDTGEITIK